MLIKNIVVSLIIVFGNIIGCSIINNTNIPPENATFICRIRPLVITFNNGSEWTEYDICERLNQLDIIYESAKIQFQLLETEFFEYPDIYNMDNNFLKVSELCKRYSDEKGEFAVCFLNKIQDSRGSWGGLANYPSNLPSLYQYGIAISRSSSKNSVAHEIGHGLCDLDHIWEHIKTNDVPSTGPNDCVNAIQACNIMSYCLDFSISFPAQCKDLILSKQQINRARTWVSCAPRNKVVDSSIPIVQKLMKYTTNTQPAY
jgi:hypothetical protein